MRKIYGVSMHRPLREDERERLMKGVSAQRRANVEKFAKAEDACRGLIGEMLIRSVVRDKFHLSNDRISFAANRYGKPYVIGLPSFHFNVSHSGRWVVCAVAEEPVGIDIEEVRPIDLQLAKSFFSREEYRYLMEKEDHQRVSRFYEIWTVKESFMKWTGSGLSLPPQSFSIHVTADRHDNLLTLAYPDTGCFFRRLHLTPDYKMAVCSRTGYFSEPLILKSVDDLILVADKECEINGDVPGSKKTNDYA